MFQVFQEMRLASTEVSRHKHPRRCAWPVLGVRRSLQHINETLFGSRLVAAEFAHGLPVRNAVAQSLHRQPGGEIAERVGHHSRCLSTKAARGRRRD